MDGYKHYIQTNEAGIIIHGFSSAFEQPKAGDLELSGQEGRHFQVPLLTDRMQYKYKITNGAMAERTQAELDDEWAARPHDPPSEVETLRQELNEMTVMLGDLLLGGV
ncbi:hypothetical protein [Paenibacillus sp. sgz302251]|uniref:hypothetical protein n=1 Tax=Paenibacillus sp. sgz302251 TaxID=3414493 RepID=UPI003C7D45EE